jgi:hypothetical protein
MANHARISFSVPKPPSHTDTYNNPDETLAWINKRISEVISSPQLSPTKEQPILDRTTYLVIYSTIHDLAARSRSPQHTPGPSQGERLYYSLADIIRNHCKHLRTKILQQRHPDADAVADRDLAVLQSYVQEFKRYRALAGLFAHLFSNVDKHWCKQMLDEGKAGVYQIRDLLWRVWKEEVVIGGRGAEQKEASVEDGFESLVDVAVRLRERGDRTTGTGGDVDQVLLELIDEVFGSFDEAGVVVVGTWVAERFHGAGPLRDVDSRVVKRASLSNGLEIVHSV